MGGCRCTYRNCSVKSDGKTHMFHYPVFEKVRCHHWLVNAHRLDFLDLKVSQLKNRVVCQHHFTDENFMNYKKDKLTFNAIPTENGPFCDTSKFVDPSKDNIKSYPNLLLEDIENEVIFNDKKANFSLKYADFLTNGELIDSSARYNSSIIHLSKSNSITNLNSNFMLTSNKEMTKTQTELFKPRFTRLSLPTKTVKQVKNPQPVLIVPPYTDLSYDVASGNIVNQEQGTIKIYQPDVTSNLTNSHSLINLCNEPQKSNTIVVKKEPKIKILSEQKIEGPIPITGKLEIIKVPPSMTINIPDKSKEGNNIKNSLIDTGKREVEVVEVLDVEYDPRQLKSDITKPEGTRVEVINSDTNVSNINSQAIKLEEIPKVVSKTNTEAPLKNSQQQTKIFKLKTKLTPERTAAIKEKRKFNMRMKDILETCLDKLDEPVISKEKTPSPIKTSSRSLIKQPNMQVSTHLAKEESLPNLQEYTIAYLDERMKSMERLLINKIEKNSQKIMELTESFGNVEKRKPVQKKNVTAQTNDSEEQYKRFLYQEISKYISQDTKSSIYEELFINKFALVDNSPQRKKRRKCI